MPSAFGVTPAHHLHRWRGNSDADEAHCGSKRRSKRTCRRRCDRVQVRPHVGSSAGPLCLRNRAVSPTHHNQGSIEQAGLGSHVEGSCGVGDEHESHQFDLSSACSLEHERLCAWQLVQFSLCTRCALLFALEWDRLDDIAARSFGDGKHDQAEWTRTRELPQLLTA